jgi:hypothetical protein
MPAKHHTSRRSSTRRRKYHGGADVILTVTKDFSGVTHTPSRDSNENTCVWIYAQSHIDANKLNDGINKINVTHGDTEDDITAIKDENGTNIMKSGSDDTTQPTPLEYQPDNPMVEKKIKINDINVWVKEIKEEGQDAKYYLQEVNENTPVFNDDGSPKYKQESENLPQGVPFQGGMHGKVRIGKKMYTLYVKMGDEFVTLKRAMAVAHKAAKAAKPAKKVKTKSKKK